MSACNAAPVCDVCDVCDDVLVGWRAERNGASDGRVRREGMVVVPSPGAPELATADAGTDPIADERYKEGE